MARRVSDVRWDWHTGDNPSCGVPSFTMLGTPSPEWRGTSGPNIVTGGTRGERDGERARRVSGSRSELQAVDSASCGRAGHDVSGSFIRGKIVGPLGRETSCRAPSGSAWGRRRDADTQVSPIERLRARSLCSSAGPSSLSRERDSRPLGGAHGVRAYRFAASAEAAVVQPPATSDERRLGGGSASFASSRLNTASRAASRCATG
jgi:hypothetical protein